MQFLKYPRCTPSMEPQNNGTQLITTVELGGHASEYTNCVTVPNTNHSG